MECKIFETVVATELTTEGATASLSYDYSTIDRGAAVTGKQQSSQLWHTPLHVRTIRYNRLRRFVHGHLFVSYCDQFVTLCDYDHYVHYKKNLST